MDHVWDELAPRLAVGPLSGSEKYEFAAKVALWRIKGSRQIADLFLRAAWRCVDEADREAERTFRRLAAWTFEEALALGDATGLGERATLTYLTRPR